MIEKPTPAEWRAYVLNRELWDERSWEAASKEGLAILRVAKGVGKWVLTDAGLDLFNEA